MITARLFALALAGCVIVSTNVRLVQADTITQDFSTDPAAQGWQVFGSTNLFHWNATNQNLEVRWDSSAPNSYFYHPLGAVLGKADDFQISFDLILNDIAAGVTPGEPDALQVAVGLQNFAEATSPGFIRGVYGAAYDLVEFDYFPYAVDPVYGPIAETISPVIISHEVNFAYFFDDMAMTTQDLYHIQLTYTASDQTMATVMTRNGQPFGPVGGVVLGAFAGFDDYQVDTIAIASYGDAGDGSSSLLAHGIIDNLAVTVPPPVARVSGGISGGFYQAQFASRTNWLYTLEKTADFRAWTPVSVTLAGTGAGLTLQDTNALSARAFYRVQAVKP